MTTSNENQILEKAIQPLAIYDRQLKKLVNFNQKLVDLLEYTSVEEMLNVENRWFLNEEQFNNLTAPQLIEKIEFHLSKFEVFLTSVLVSKKNGDTLILEMTAMRNYLADEYQTLLFFHEINENYLAHKAVLDKSIIYKTIIAGAFDYIDIHEILEIDPINYNYLGILIDRSDSMKEGLGIKNEPLISIESMMRFTPTDFLKENGQSVYKLISQLREKRSIVFDWKFIKKDGSHIMLSVGSYLVDVGSKLILVRIMRDITAKVANETTIKNNINELLEKNKKLEAYIQSNMQLENFAYIASHDMKAPLRTINSFAKILEKKLENRLTEEEKDLFSFITQGSQDLTMMVEDLLAFSTISNKKINIDIINTKNLFEDLRSKLSNLITETNTTIILGNYPPVFMADPLKIFRVFQNLLQNAMKFSKKEEAPVIEIKGWEDSSNWYFEIKDNGIGIKEEYQEAIFLMFRRLNGSEFSGTGMGLSLVQKILEQHKGNIDVTSKYGEGSTFTFHIEKKKR